MDELHQKIIEEFKKFNLEGILKALTGLKKVPGKVYDEKTDKSTYSFDFDRGGVAITYIDSQGNEYDIHITKIK